VMHFDTRKLIHVSNCGGFTALHICTPCGNIPGEGIALLPMKELLSSLCPLVRLANCIKYFSQWDR